MTALRAPRVLEYRPLAGRLNDETIAWMAELIRDGSMREDVRQLCEEWLYQKRVPPRDDVAEAIALYGLVYRRVPYRRDPAYKERVKAPWVSLGLEGGKAGRGGDCDDIATALGACLLAMGLGPVRLRTVGVGTPSHVHVEAWITRPKALRGWLSLDPVAHPRPPGFRPPGTVEHLYPIDTIPSPAMQGVPMMDVRELAAEIAEARPYGLHAFPPGVTMAGFPGAEGNALVYMGSGPLSDYYADAEGGVWEQSPLGIFRSLKRGISRAGRIAKGAASVYTKLARPAATAALFIPGIGPGASAALLAADKAARYALKASAVTDQLARIAKSPGRISVQPSAEAWRVVESSPRLLELARKFHAVRRDPRSHAITLDLFGRQRAARRQGTPLGSCGCHLERIA